MSQIFCIPLLPDSDTQLQVIKQALCAWWKFKSKLLSFVLNTNDFTLLKGIIIGPNLAQIKLWTLVIFQTFQTGLRPNLA